MAAGRQPHNQAGHALIRLEVAEIDLRPVGALALPPEEEQAGGEMGDDGGPGHAGHVPMEDDDEDRVQDDIHDGGDDEGIHGFLRIPQAADQAVHAVVYDVAAGADEYDAQISRALVQDLIRRAQQLQQGPGEEEAQDGDDDAGEHAQGEGGGHGLFQVLMILGTLVLAYDDVGAHAHAHEQGAEEHHHGEAGVDGGQAGRTLPGKVAHDQAVHHVVKLLEQVARDGGQGKEQDLLGDRPLGQVMVVLRPESPFFFGHTITLS